MKKFSLPAGLALFTFLMGCSQMRTEMKKKPSPSMSRLMDTVDLENEDILRKKPVTGEYTHEIVEAKAEDAEIKNELGVAESDIDEEVPVKEAVVIPYSKNFLKQKNTARMEFWVEFFTKKDRARFQRFLNNGEEYRHHIEEIFMEYGLPKELYFVGLIESGFYLGARSHASAVGPWQFIKSTGKRYGLKINHEMDERQDLFKATRAAATFFRDLHHMFQSWELALAAYNSGENGLLRRIRKYGTKDYYQLSKNKRIASETINYVPKVLAAMHVVNNAEKYGFILPKKAHRIFDLTELKPIKKNTSLSIVADKLSINVHLLKKLNPELKRYTTPRFVSGNYLLRVPSSKYSYRLNDLEAKGLSAMIQDRPEPRREITRRTAEFIPRQHKVKRGETLLSIARKYNKTAKELAIINDFKSWKTKVQEGQSLDILALVPARTLALASAKIKNTRAPIVYKVRSGDNLTDLARLFNLKISKIKTANNLKRGKIQIGQKIVLPDTLKGIYIVKRGDHLTKVAKDFNQPIEVLVKLNSLKRRQIYPGQKIIVNID